MTAETDSPIGERRPPCPPWQALRPAEPASGYVSYYLADELASWPVRAVTRIKDNKSDPNLETGTYGLFSTCQEKMRAGVVGTAPRYLFFVTRPRAAERHLVGFYEVGWWAPGSLHLRIRDFALAAVTMRFIDPVPLSKLPAKLGSELGGKWRLNKRLGPTHTSALQQLILGRPDRTPEYLAEIDRMETINSFHSGFRYPTWRRTQPWTWGDAPAYLKPAAFDPAAPRIRNSSPTGWWRCARCDSRTENAALLKACPQCGELDSLRAVTSHELTREI